MFSIWTGNLQQITTIIATLHINNLYLELVNYVFDSLVFRKCYVRFGDKPFSNFNEITKKINQLFIKNQKYMLSA